MKAPESTKRQEEMFGREFLDEILNWVVETLDVEEIYDKETLAQWVASNCDIEDVYSEVDAVDWLKRMGYTVEMG